MTYQQTLETLYAMMPDFQKVGAQAYKPGLERIADFDRHLGCPSKEFYSIHVAGTNGKGSVSHMVAAVLRQAGYRVGLYTSPHLKDFRERIKVDGEMISKEAVVEFSQRNMEKMKELDLSFFEATVGMAFEWFSELQVDVAVVETGLGGRLDATNIINPLVSMITNIGIEHTSFLGNTLSEIAAEKGGIIKRWTPVVVGEHNAETDPIFEHIARQREAKIIFAQDRYRCIGARESNDGSYATYTIEPLDGGNKVDLDLDLLGDYQRQNIVTVLAATEVIDRHTPLDITPKAVVKGLASAAKSTGLAGRWQVIGQSPLVVCDTGHNADGLRQVVGQIARQSYDKLYVVFGVANDKDLSVILPLMPTKAHYIFTQAAGERALPAEELSCKAAEYGLKGEVSTSVAQALELARSMAGADDMVFIGGSSFVVAEV